MPDFDARPDLTFLDGHQKYLEGVWDNARKNWAETDTFHQLSYDVWTGPNAAVHLAARGQYRPPTARTIIDHSADQFMALIPTVHREPSNEDSDAQKLSADNVEVAVKSILMDSALHSITNPWRLLGKHFNAFGYGIIQIDLAELDPRYEADRPRPAYWNPVRIDAVNPGQVLIDPLEKIPNAAIKMWQASAQDVATLLESKKKLKYKGSFDMSAHNPWDIITMISHWTGKHGWLTVREAGKEVLYQQPNSWNFVPFNHAFAGYGMEPTGLDRNDPQFMAQGLVDPLKPTLRLQAQSRTAKHTMTIDHAYANYGTSGDPEEFVRALDTGEPLQGEEAKFWKMKPHDVPRWLFESDRETDEMIERSVGASARGGQRQPGVDTVGQQAILNNQMRRKFIGPSLQQEHMGSIVGGWILQLVDKLDVLKGGIGAHGKLLKRSDIGGNYDISVTFDPLDPTMEAQRRAMFREEYLMGLLDDEGYWRETGVQNITQRREALNRQRVRNSPSVVAKTARITAQAMAELDDEDVSAVTEEAAAGALPLVASNGSQPQEQRQPLDDQTFKPQRLDNVNLE
jgi:hypothetical protein